MKAKILISGRQKLEAYADAVESLGAVAVAEYLPKDDGSYDALMLAGGNDIDPAIYGEEINGAVNIDEDRDECDLALIESFISSGKPIMGICRGYQLLNAYFGGTLCQHIPTTEIHTSTDTLVKTHTVTAEGGICRALYGGSFVVNSYHHQAIERLGDGLVVTASADGMIEAIEHKTLKIFGVQWHPERMIDNPEGSPLSDGKLLFEYFLKLVEGAK